MAPPSTAPGRSWQPILGAVLLIAGLIIGVIAVVALTQPSGQKSTTGTRQTGSTDDTAAPTASATTAAPARASVVVLNSTAIAGLASTAAADLTAGGWTVTATDNFDGTSESTAAYYDSADPASKAAASALQAQFPWIVRVLERFAALPPSPIVLVLSAQY
ncbi:MAG: LytR family transcriptional regulator [Pseudonocardiales bacterium]|nr:LytR family transcriptional regulator [Pseudonocardiales bacterium]